MTEIIFYKKPGFILEFVESSHDFPSAFEVGAREDSNIEKSGSGRIQIKRSRGQEGFKYREVEAREDSNKEKSGSGRIQTLRSRGQGGFKH